MARLKGRIYDGASGIRVPAKVRVVTSGGNCAEPANSIAKVGPGDPFFYCAGEFEVSVPAGSTDIIVERGTEYCPLRQVVTVAAGGAMEVDLELTRWTDLPSQGWYPGNTHIHYNELESRPDERLRLDPEVHDLSVTAISVLQRRELPYASNKYPIGFMTDFSTDHRQVDCGEENRHNALHGGYGHVMLLNIRNLVQPVSRGDLVSAFDPDYPPLCYACDDARTQGGVVIWCHNGHGMEAPVAAALGKLDAFNLFDPCWKEAEYDIWYRLLNCGIELPASTGSDWFICSNNRVYVQPEGDFTYESWLQGLRSGRTFITNGPALFLEADGQQPGRRLAASGRSGHRTAVRVEWRSLYPLRRIEVVRDGDVVGCRALEDGATQREGVWELDIAAGGDGWLAVPGLWRGARQLCSARVRAHQPGLCGNGPANGQGGGVSHRLCAGDRAVQRDHRPLWALCQRRATRRGPAPVRGGKGGVRAPGEGRLTSPGPGATSVQERLLQGHRDRRLSVEVRRMEERAAETSRSARFGN